MIEKYANAFTVEVVDLTLSHLTPLSPQHVIGLVKLPVFHVTSQSDWLP